MLLANSLKHFIDIVLQTIICLVNVWFLILFDINCLGLNYVLAILKKQNNFLTLSTSFHQLFNMAFSSVWENSFSYSNICELYWKMCEFSLKDFNIIFLSQWFSIAFQWWQILLPYCGWCYCHFIVLSNFWQMLCQLTMFTRYQYWCLDWFHGWCYIPKQKYCCKYHLPHVWDEVPNNITEL